MSEQPSWKIVPGAEYRAMDDTYSAIPTAVYKGEDIVYYQLKTYFPDGTSVIHGSQNSNIATFCRSYAPEDQSCIPYLVAALKAAEWCADADMCACCQSNQDDGHVEGCAVDEALRKAGAR